MGDQDRISPYNINTISSRQVMRIKKSLSLENYKLIQYQIPQTNMTRTEWEIVRRITNEILGVKGLKRRADAEETTQVGKRAKCNHLNLTSHMTGLDCN